MRITQSLSFRNLRTSIEEIQSRKYLNEVRLASGKQIVDLSQSPNELSQAKKFEEFISTQQQYKRNLDYANGFIQQTINSIENISNNIQKIREIAIDASKTAVANEVSTLGKSVLGLIKDIVKELNSDFAGKYIFSGTKITPYSIAQPPGSTNTLPFELVQDNPSSTNPSGLRIIFKGNVNKISVNFGKGNAEIINSTTDELFGDTLGSSLNNLIDLYNLLTFNENGLQRTQNDLFNSGDIAKLDVIQKKIGEMIDRVNRVASNNGSKLIRIDSQREQLSNLITLYNGFKSKLIDTDYASVSIELTKEQTALQYALQVGSRVLQSTLFDFIR
ncbi:MAG: flagellin N-terminal helical domain-containing protein [Candidatus Kapaibacteriales bacterium]